MGKLVVEVSPNGRASCRNCKRKIMKDSVRVGTSVFKLGGMGIDLHHPSTSSTHWMHAMCCLVADVAPNGRFKCHGCERRIEKDHVRVGVWGSTMSAVKWQHVSCAREALDDSALSSAGISISRDFNPWWIRGFEKLSDKQQNALMDKFGLSLAQHPKPDWLERANQILPAMPAAGAATKKRKSQAEIEKNTVKSCRFG